MRICVGVSGSIAAYRSPDLVKELIKHGHEVQVAPTRQARKFVSDRVLSTFSQNPILTPDAFDSTHKMTDHISTARWAECFVVYGATANFIARYANGFASDFLSLQLLAADCPVLIVPAMNPTMWEHPAVQENCQKLRSRGVIFVGPIHGKVACGEVGQGHVAELSEILDAVHGLRDSKSIPQLAGKKVLISAGPMRTQIDPVRFIQNRSSGQMALEVSKAIEASGGQVTVLLGPVDSSLADQFKSFKVVRYTESIDYIEHLKKLFPEADVFISLAAVLDFEVLPMEKKMDRESLSQGTLQIRIKKVADWVAQMAAHKKPGQKVIAFAAETGSESSLLERAKQKMLKKGVDALVANPVTELLGPDSPDNELWVMKPGQKPIHLGPAPKSDLALPLVQALFS